MPEYVVDAEFKKVNRRLSRDEYATLEKIILREGILDDFRVWVDEEGSLAIVDGMNRFSIHQKHPDKVSLPEDYIQMPGSREDIVEWILETQAGRRNEKLAMAKYRDGVQHRKEAANGKSISEIAKESGKARATVRQEIEHSEAVEQLDEEVADAVLSGDVEASLETVKELAEVPEEEQKEAVEEAIETGQPVEVKKPKPDHRIKDCHARFRVAQKALTTFKSALQEIQSKFGGELAASEPALERNVKEIENHLSAIKPAGLCPYCDGKVAGSVVERTQACVKCQGRGWLAKAALKQVPEDVKDAYERRRTAGDSAGANG